MKINPSHVSKALGVYNTQKAANPKEPKKGAELKDQVSISNTAQSFQMALKAAKESPDIRTAKVEEIKARIAAGTYNVSSSDIAEKMIESAMLNKKV